MLHDLDDALEPRLTSHAELVGTDVRYTFTKRFRLSRDFCGMFDIPDNAFLVNRITTLTPVAFKLPRAPLCVPMEKPPGLPGGFLEAHPSTKAKG